MVIHELKDATFNESLLQRQSYGIMCPFFHECSLQVQTQRENIDFQ